MGRGSYCKNAKKSGVGARVGVWSGWSRGVSVGGSSLGVRVVVNEEFKLL